MKFFSSSIFSLIFVFSFYANVGLAETAAQSELQKCYSDCGKKPVASDFTGDAANSAFQSALSEYNSCRSDCKSESKDTQTRCEAATKKLDTAREKNPCTGTTNIAACEDQINSCVESSSAAFGAEGGDDAVSGLMGTAMQLFGANQDSDPNSATAFKVDRSCYGKFSKSKEIREREKERQSRLKELKKDIEDEVKKQNDATKDLNKEKAEVVKEEQKLNSEFKKFKATQEKSKREKFTQINEDIQKNSTTIRNMNVAILKAQQDIDRINFEHQKNMMDYTEDKINKQCKSALEIAKVCFVKASKGQVAAKEDTCSNFTFSGKGAKGTAALKEKLLQVREACFEQSNKTISTLKYNHADLLRKSEMDIKEKKEQINDANKALELKQKEFEAITKETDAEITEEEQNVSQQITNLRAKLADMTAETNKLIEDSKAIIADRQKEINELAAGKLATDLGLGESGSSIYEDIANEAQGALASIKDATVAAIGSCCRDPDMKLKNKDTCNQLEATQKKSRSRTRTKTGTER